MTMQFEPITATNGTGVGSARLLMRSRGSGSAIAAGSGEGRAMLGMRSSGRLESTTVIVNPPIPAYGTAQLFGRSSGTGYGQEFGDGEAMLGGTSRGMDGAGGSAMLGMRSSGSDLPELTAYGMLVERESIMYGYGDQWFVTLTDPVVMRGNVVNLPVAVLREVVRVQSEVAARYAGTHRITDRAVFGERLGWIVPILLREGIAVGTGVNPDFLQVVRVVARVLASGQASNIADAIAVVSDGIVFLATTGGLTKAEITDTVVLGAAVETIYAYVARALERVLMRSAATGTQIMVAVVREQVLMGASLTHQAELTMVLRDAVGFVATLSFDDGEYIAWVLNVESKGLSSYTNFPHNSFANIGGRWAGATSQGLEWLDGDDDNGEDIHAFIRSGLHAFGTRLNKGMPEAFIGYASDGTLLLKMVVVDEESGDKHAAIYRLPARGAANIRANRFKVGRGLESVDWAFEIHNVDGAAFDLASVQFRPVILTRRTRG